MNEVKIFRICDDRYRDDPFSPKGSMTHGGRWNIAGVPMVYAATSRYGADKEYSHYAKYRRNLLTKNLYQSFVYESDIEVLDTMLLPLDWSSKSVRHPCGKLGGEWIDSVRSLVLKVPSSVMAGEHIYLLNPNHKGFEDVKKRCIQLPYIVEERQSMPEDEEEYNLLQSLRNKSKVARKKKKSTKKRVSKKKVSKKRK